MSELIVIGLLILVVCGFVGNLFNVVLIIVLLLPEEDGANHGIGDGRAVCHRDRDGQLRETGQPDW